MKRLSQFVERPKSILCLDGNIDGIARIQHNLQVIAADGAANKLLDLNIIPEAIIGDLDSFNVLKMKTLYPNKLESNIICDTSQNTTDFQKAMRYLEINSLLPSVIFGIGGGYIDHVMNNINIFMESRSVFIDNSIVGLTILSLETKEFNLPKNTKISIIGMPQCQILSSGLKWELENTYLNFPGHNSCLNRTIKDKIKISVKSGVALVLIYLENVVDYGTIHQNMEHSDVLDVKN